MFLWGTASIIFFLALIVWGIYRTNTIRENNKSTAENHFSIMRDTVTSKVEESGKIQGIAVKDIIEERMELYPPIRAVFIYSHDRGVELFLAREDSKYSIPPDIQNVWNGELSIEINSITQQQLVSRLDIKDKPGYSILAVYQILKPKDIYQPLWDIMIALIVYLIVTVAILIITMLLPSKQGYKPESSKEKETTAWQKTSASVSSEEHTYTETENPLTPGNMEFPEVDIPEEETIPVDNGKNEIKDEEASWLTETHISEDQQKSEEQVQNEKSDSDKPCEPSLFTEEGIGWEAFAEKRISMELERAASFNIELVCTIVQYKDKTEYPEEFQNFIAVVLQWFPFQDLVFAHGNDAVTIVFCNMDIEHARREAELLSRRIRERLGEKETLRIGLSARNGRILAGNRLMYEAEGALSRAKKQDEGKGMIIAFYPDAEKYREYLKKTNQK